MDVESFLISSYAFSFAENPCFQVEIIIGMPLIEFLFFLFKVLEDAVVPISVPNAPADVFLIKLLLFDMFIYLNRKETKLINFLYSVLFHYI